MFWRRALLVEHGQGIDRRIPLVACFLGLPWLRKTVLKPHIPARICGSAKTNLIPGPGVRVIRSDTVVQEKRPKAIHRKRVPDRMRRLRLSVMDGLQYEF